MTLPFFTLLFFSTISLNSWSYSLKNISDYRQLTKTVRPHSEFQITLPNGQLLDFSYQLELTEALYNNPLISSLHLGSGDNDFSISFWDKVFTSENSSLNIGNEKLPITCIYIHGQDNRQINDLSPLFPQFLMEVYIVVGNYTCTGPINPGWPANGGKKELWDTYIHYKIKDPTIMLPTETVLRLRWNEYNAYLTR